MGVVMAALKRIHVNQHIIRANAKKPDPATHEPPLTIKHKTTTYKAWEVEVSGTMGLVYKPEKPLTCGARVWLETKASVWFIRPDGEWSVIE